MTVDGIMRSGVCLSCGAPCIYTKLQHCDRCFDQAEEAEKTTGTPVIDVLQRMVREYTHTRVDTTTSTQHSSVTVERVHGRILLLAEGAGPTRWSRKMRFAVELTDHLAAELEAALRRARGALVVTDDTADALANERETIASEIVHLSETQHTAAADLIALAAWVRSGSAKKTPPAATTTGGGITPKGDPHGQG